MYIIWFVFWGLLSKLLVLDIGVMMAQGFKAWMYIILMNSLRCVSTKCGQQFNWCLLYSTEVLYLLWSVEKDAATELWILECNGTNYDTQDRFTFLWMIGDLLALGTGPHLSSQDSLQGAAEAEPERLGCEGLQEEDRSVAWQSNWLNAVSFWNLGWHTNH